MRSVWLVLVAAVGLLGCPEKSVDAVIDSGPPETVDAGPIDAGPPVPATLEPTVMAMLIDGGVTELKPNAEIDQAIELRLQLPFKLKDFRVRLLDWREQIVVSDDEVDPAGLTLIIKPSEPLKTGRGYGLVLDAELGPVVTDEAGRTFNDWELPFRILGDVQPVPAAAKPAKKKRK